ncbi:hypothetical protein NE237_003553 [Protea cynaroides]|uniref:Pectinesterase n=1 Tax=Protea cynaroides TaxID=273540 RepID=A0A9Q0QSU6_9MAGN|nr:hypothetical protein NE237_003553 [Protea cynaroides]
MVMMKSPLPLFFFLIVLQLSPITSQTCNVKPPPSTETTSVICVDQNGCCNFTTVQAAVNAVDAFSQKMTIIWINTGTYVEKVIVPENKTNLTFQGQGLQSTIISWNDRGDVVGTYLTGSVEVYSNNFIAKNISFMNGAGPGTQAVAIRISGDKAAFWGCGFLGNQDTLLDDEGRHYFKDCFIQGTVDFIFGGATSLYENCELNSIANATAGCCDAAITANGREKNDTTGFAFVNCNITGTGRINLGRAWRPFARVVFSFTTISNIIVPEGWNDMGHPERQETVFFGEYQNSGDGAYNRTKRVSYSRNLTDTEAAPFLTKAFINGDQWLQPFA